MTETRASGTGVHILFWGIIWLSISSIAMMYDPDPTLFLVKFLELALIIPGTRVLSSVVLPNIFEKRYLQAGLIAFATLIVYSLLRRLLFQTVLFPIYYDQGGYTFDFWNWYRIIADLLAFIGFAGLFIALHYLMEYRASKDRLRQLKTEKQEAELQFLKAQIHPHFLFNTLNALYLEVLKQTEKAPDMMIQLASVLRFVLHESKKETIPLAKELELVNNYADLMRMRYGDRLQFSLESNAKETNQLLPMLLFSLVENAFKHGVSEESKECFVHVNIQESENDLQFLVRNSYSQQSAANNDVWDSKEGIGLDNLRRQLELYYGSNQSLSNENSDTEFTSRLIIKKVHEKV